MKAVAYARFSSDNQREESITAQFRIIREYAERNGIVIIKEYFDEAKSASTFAKVTRDHFEEMIDDIYNERISPDCVIFHKVDRFSRDRIDFAFAKYKLNKRNVKILYAEQYIPEGPEGILIESLLEGMAEYYSKNLSREVKKGMRENALAAKHRGGRPPLGYDVDKETMKYVINPQEAETVKLIFKMLIDGYSLMQIVREMNRRGYMTKKGNPFGKNSIHEILVNPKYVGKYVANRYSDEQEFTLEGEIPAIVDQSTWEQVYKIMDSRKRIAPKTKNTIYLLTGKLFCGECGAAYTGNFKIGGRGYKYKTYFYNCVNRKQKKSCNNPDVIKEVIENYVLDELEAAFQQKSAEKLADEVESKYKEISKTSQEEIERIKGDLKKITLRIENLLEALELKTTPSTIVGPRLTELSTQKETLEYRLKELEDGETLPYTREEIINYVIMQQQCLAKRDDLKECKKMIERYVSRVTLYKDKIAVEIKIKKDHPDDDPNGRGYHGGPEAHLTLSTQITRANLYEKYLYGRYKNIRPQVI